MKILVTGCPEWFRSGLAGLVHSGGHDLAFAPDPENAASGEADVLVVWRPEPAADDGAGSSWSEDAAVRGVRSAFELAERARVSRVILVSGIEAAGPRTLAEGAGHEGAPERPVDSAGRAYLAAEREALAARARTGMSLVILRAGHLYAHGVPGALGGIVDALRGDASASLEETWADASLQPLHATDLARAVVLAAGKGDGTYHVTASEVRTVGSIVEELQAFAAKRGLPVRAIKPLRSAVASSGRVHYAWPSHRAARELGWTAAWSPSFAASSLLDPEIASEASAGVLADPRDLSLEAAAAAAGAATTLEREASSGTRTSGVPRLSTPSPTIGPTTSRLRTSSRSRRTGSFTASTRRAVSRPCSTSGAARDIMSRALAHYLGVRCIGIDVAGEKIRRGRVLAERQGVADLVDLQVADALTFQTPEPVDVLMSCGTLHHFPDLEVNLPKIIERNLKPGGWLIAFEPYCEAGYHPALGRLTAFMIGGRLRRFFDTDRYEQIKGGMGPSSLRFESPAGVESTGTISTSTVISRAEFDARFVRYDQFLAPFVCANAFVIFQKSRVVRGLTRALMPVIVRLDGLMCRTARFRKWAAIGMYGVQRR